MQRSVPVNLSSTDPRPQMGRVRHELLATFASWRAMTRERLFHFGAGGLFLILMAQPLVSLTLLSVIYDGNPRLLSYVVVAQAAFAFVMNTIFWVGEILDRERVRGTLVPLFLAPCARFSWLSGFILAGLVETVIVATVALTFGSLAFGVRLDPNLPVLLVALPLFLLSLWGIGLVFSGIGLILKKSNQFANLVWPFAMLLGGAYLPVADLPDLLRIPARALPLGYGMQVLADATLHGASFQDVASDLLPLAGFALALPLLGVLAFRYLDRLVRVRGELDVY
jgi:ABC-2 type transport system permease protein